MKRFFFGHRYDGYSIQYRWSQYLDFCKHQFPFELQLLAVCIAYLWFAMAASN
jgi:hypothetical protein